MLEALITEIKTEFPSFRMVKKSDSRLMKVIHAFLIVLTFGQMRAFMDGYITTIGYTIYTSSSWDGMRETSKATVLRHERIHLRQQKRWTRPLFSFLYLIPFFPFFFAYGRARFEIEAYRESVRATLEYQGAQALTEKYKDTLVSQFTTASYGWMWIYKPTITKWIDKAIEDALKEQGTK